MVKAVADLFVEDFSHQWHSSTCPCGKITLGIAARLGRVNWPLHAASCKRKNIGF